MSGQDAGSERISLTMRTSWLSEFRTRGGALARFDVAGDRITFGRLCAALGRIEGIEFAEWRVPARYDGPTPFRYKGKDYVLSIAHDDYRITVSDVTGDSNADEFLRRIKELLVWRNRSTN